MGVRVSDLAIMQRLARQKWGNINQQRKIAEGVYWFDCVGHGGYIADIDMYPKAEEFQETVYIRRNSSKYYPCEQRFAAFEEDCDWSVLEYWYPEISENFINKFDFVNGEYSYEDRRRDVLLCTYGWNEDKMTEEDIEEVERIKEEREVLT